MKIVKEGKLPEVKVKYKATCPNCGCVIHLLESEIVFERENAFTKGFPIYRKGCPTKGCDYQSGLCCEQIAEKTGIFPSAFDSWCMCSELVDVARDLKSTCQVCGGIDAYGTSKNRPTVFWKKEI